MRRIVAILLLVVGVALGIFWYVQRAKTRALNSGDVYVRERPGENPTPLPPSTPAPPASPATPPPAPPAASPPASTPPSPPAPNPPAPAVATPAPTPAPAA